MLYEHRVKRSGKKEKMYDFIQNGIGCFSIIGSFRCFLFWVDENKGICCVDLERVVYMEPLNKGIKLIISTGDVITINLPKCKDENDVLRQIMDAPRFDGSLWLKETDSKSCGYEVYPRTTW